MQSLGEKKKLTANEERLRSLLISMSLLDPVGEEVSPARRWVYIVTATFLSLTLSGIIFGWPAVELMLEREGVYHYLCVAANDTAPVGGANGTSTNGGGACLEQVAMFNLIFVIASTGFACAVLPFGIVLDRFGPKVSALLGSSLIGAGTVLFAFSNPPTFDVYIPSYLLIAMGGPPLVFSFMHLSNLFPSRKGTIITLLNVALDASALVFVLLEALHAAFYPAITLRGIFLVFTGLPAVSLLIAVFLWPRRAFEQPLEGPPTPVRAEPIIYSSTDEGETAARAFAADISTDPNEVVDKHRSFKKIASPTAETAALLPKKSAPAPPRTLRDALFSRTFALGT